MRKSTRLLRKVVLLIIALPIFALGVVLIPLPGPGLLICLLALIILSYEFEAAKKYRDKILGTLKAIIAKSREAARQREQR